jgi:RND family efflux transporter MFP subunit
MEIRHRLHRPTLAALAMAALVLASPLFLAGCGAKEHPSHPLPEPPPVRAKALTLQAESTPITYLASGQVQPVLRASLSAKVLARVQTVLVREGDTVSVGQTLIRLDSRELTSGLDIAQANSQAARAGVATASTAAAMEEKMSKARIQQAEAQLVQAQAASASAQASLDLAMAGPRTQQISQAEAAVAQSKSSLTLAEAELNRTRRLVEDGALAKRQLDLAQNNYDLAKGQYETAQLTLSMAQEGTRAQEIQAAREALRQAQAGVEQARAGIAQARAAALQKDLRREEVGAAKAVAAQSEASVRGAKVMLAHSTLAAPFSGKIVKRFADPGAMASPGVPLLEIEGGGLRLEALLPESLLSSISIGTVAKVSFDALQGEPVLAKVAEIVPRSDASTHTFLVKFALAEDSRLKSGLFGRVEVTTGTAKKMLISTSNTWRVEGLDYVYTVNKEGVIRLRVVTLGRPSDGRVEVLSGLNPGDRIVVGDRKGVADGARLMGDGQ